MPSTPQDNFSSSYVLTILLIVLISISSIFYMLDITPDILQHYISLLPTIIAVLLLILFSHLYIWWKFKIARRLSSEYEIIKSDAEHQSLQLDSTQLELSTKTDLLDMLQQANLDFVEHSQLQRTAQFMIDKLMHITNSECGFIGEVLKQQDGENIVNIFSVCHRSNESTYLDKEYSASERRDNKTTENAAHDQDLIKQVLSTRKIVIRNNVSASPEDAGMPGCCNSIKNTMLIPVFYGTEILGIYGLADSPVDFDEKIINLLKPFNATYAVLSRAKRSYSEQAVIQENLLHAKLEADRANYAKSDFLSRMSHELRTPLNVILGYSQLLLDEVQYKIEPDVANCLSKVEQSGLHLLKLINEVLDLSHVESGALDVELKSINLHRAMLEAIDMVTVLSEQKNIKIIYNQRDFEDINVQSDRLRLLQVLVNLFSNAIKYNHLAGQVTISGSTSDNSFIIAIHDTGIGIPNNKRNKLFVAFDRLGAESSDIEGTGIGLPITKKLIEIMGGKLTFTSQINKGSTFYIHLNKKSSAEKFDGMATSNQAIYLKGIEKGSHTILYIEDNVENTKLVERILSKYPSIKLVTASDGLTGIQLASSLVPDLILLDVQLPDLTGFDVLRRIKANEKLSHIPILGVSANAMTKDVHDALAAGFNNYITKPINIRIFLEVVNDTLETIN